MKPINKNTRTILSHILFWLAIFFYHVIIANLNYFSGGYNEIFKVFIFKTAVQILLAYTVLWFFSAYFSTKKWLLFFSVIVLLLIAYVLYHLFRIYYLEPSYPDSYTDFNKNNPNITFVERLTNVKDFVSRSVFFLQPIFLLSIHKFYVKQQKILKINEQKKSNELEMLKHQLNPHFLFNTLNNLYSFAISKSEKTPEIIAKLSDILDYVLYRTKDTYVNLKNEITLIENYLSLEKIRYGNRVAISFEKKQIEDTKIAPLLLLMFIENAFKHGVSQELNVAKVSIVIGANQESITFHIQNTKSNKEVRKETTDGIGIKNVEKQLELLYKDKYNLKIEEDKKTYTVNLNLKTK